MFVPARATRRANAHALVVAAVAALLLAGVGVPAGAADGGRIHPGRYTVRSGDTAGSIAERAKVRVTIIARVNQLPAPEYPVDVGQVLRIPTDGRARLHRRPRPGGTPRGQAVVSAAQRYLGRPYQYGANGPDAFDCSGLVQRAYSDVGIKVSRSTSTQLNDGVSVGKDLSKAQPGDIVIVASDDGPNSLHDGVFAEFDSSGRPTWVHSPKTGDVVKQVPIWGRSIVDIRRVAG